MACRKSETFLVEAPSGPPEMDVFLSSSWPMAATKQRQREQPPRAPLRRPSAVNLKVPPLTLDKSPRQGFCCGSSDTTIGDFRTGSFTSSCDFSDDEGDEEPCIFSLEEGTCEDNVCEEDASLYDICIVGLEDGDEHVQPAMTLDDIASNDFKLGASPILLSALAQIQTERFPQKELLQPPKAPLLKPSPSPFEVPYFELPMPCVGLSPT